MGAAGRDPALASGRLEPLTPEQCESLAALAGHRPPADRLTPALAEVRALAESLETLDLEGVEPMAGPPRAD
jgi:hypothetical protein